MSCPNAGTTLAAKAAHAASAISPETDFPRRRFSMPPPLLEYTFEQGACFQLP
jgi:hypothetical protein